MTPRERFAKDHRLTRDQVDKLVALATRHYHAEARCASACEAHYQEMAAAVERTGQRFELEAVKMGFQRVFWPGPWPVLVKNGEQYELPSN